MTPLEATERVYETVRTGWTACAVGYDAERYEPPADAAWVRVAIRDLPAISLTHGPVGDRRKRHRSFLVAQIFAPLFPDDGVGQALTLGQSFAALFEGRDVPATPGVECLHFDEATIRRIGADGAWYQVNVELPFTFDAFI